MILLHGVRDHGSDAYATRRLFRLCVCRNLVSANNNHKVLINGGAILHSWHSLWPFTPLTIRDLIDNYGIEQRDYQKQSDLISFHLCAVTSANVDIVPAWEDERRCL